MNFRASIGFNNLPEPLWAVKEFVKAISTYVAARTKDVEVDPFKNGMSAIMYFEREATGRAPIHIRYSVERKQLVIRLEIVAASTDTTLPELLHALSTTWQAMAVILARYLKNRRVHPETIHRVASAITLPRPRNVSLPTCAQSDA
jgi:hypothetical protein